MKMTGVGIALLVGTVVLGLALSSQARVTETVNAQIFENSPLKQHDNDLWVQVGYPLLMGLHFDKYVNTHWAVGVGGGSYLNGTTVDMSIKFVVLDGLFSPFITAGPALYYTDSNKNFFALHGAVGLQWLFYSGLGFSMGAAYAHAITPSPEPFSYPWVNDQLSQLSAQFGLHLNF
jgi:hypothetical protein